MNRIKILILEHNKLDIERLLREFDISGLNYSFEVVQARECYEKFLGSVHPDIIIASNVLPHFDAISAFNILHKLLPGTPFIILSEPLEVEKVVALMKLGITDLVLKNNMGQLVPKISQALQQAAERKQKEEAEWVLRQREKQFQKIIDLSLDVICTLDQDGIFVMIGAASESSWGYLPEELVGKRAIDLVHAEDRERTIQAIADLRQGMDMVNFENRYLQKCGVYATLLWSVRWDPEQRLGYSVARNVTEIKKAAEKINNNEKRFRTLLQNSNEGLCLMAADGTILERSPSARRILELGLEETTGKFRADTGKFRLDLVHPDDLLVVQDACKQIQINPQDVLTITFRFMRRDGCYKWLETTFHNQLQEPAIGAIVLNFRDITESKLAEIALRTSEVKLKQAQAIGHMGNWEMNLADGHTVWSDEIYRLFGVDKNELKVETNTFQKFIHPDDLDLVLSRLEKAYASLKSDAMTFRIIRPDGEIRYVFSEAQFEFDEMGNAVGVFGIQQDVTDRTLAEIALAKSEDKYRSLFDLSPTPMWLYDLETLHFLDVNEAAIKHYGYSREEFLTMTLKDIRPESEIGNLATSLKNTKRSRQVYLGIFKHLKKNGEVFEVEINGSLVDLSGREARIVLVTDISDRLKYIHAIEIQNERLREIAWIQSHIVRAPLARMMGLIDLLDNYTLGIAEKPGKPEILKMISDAAKEVDKIIREIVRKTEQVNDQPSFKQQTTH